MILGTAGHIDHGKTALVRALTGVDTDRLPQEKQRGITIDIGFARLDLGETSLGIVDVPGHERFIRNMLAGATGIDVAMLVVAADDSVMPQTREHLAILELLDVDAGLIALSKCDLAEPDWLDLVEQDVRELVKGTFLEDAPIVRTSATSGDGIDALRTTLAEVTAGVRRRGLERPFRMAVDRAFVMQGRGTVVTGTVWSGALEDGGELEWLPAGSRVTVRGLQTHGRPTDRVQRGERAAINLGGVHHEQIGRGHELATPGYLRASRVLTVDVRVLGESPRPLRHRGRVRLHLGTQEIIATVRLLAGATLEPDARGLAQLYCAEPAIATAGQPFVLRAESLLVTIGGGHVLEPVARPIRRRDRDAIAALESRRSDDEPTRVAAAIRAAGDRDWDALGLCREADVPSDRVEAIVTDLRDRGVIVELDAGPRRTLVLHEHVLAQIEQRIVDALRRLHEQTPLGTRVARSAVLQKLAYLEARTVDAVVDRLLASDRLVGDERAVGLPEAAPRLSETQRRLRDCVIETFATAGFSPPQRSELARTHGVEETQVQPILELCASEGQLRHLGGGLFLHDRWERQLRARLRERLADGHGLTMAELRDLLGTSRKYAVPIGEYLDRIGLTRRVGDQRVLSDAAMREPSA